MGGLIFNGVPVMYGAQTPIQKANERGVITEIGG